MKKITRSTQAKELEQQPENTAWRKATELKSGKKSRERGTKANPVYKKKRGGGGQWQQLCFADESNDPL